MAEGELKHVGNLTVSCPMCGEVMEVGILAGMERKDDGKYYVTTNADVADLWAHSFMHKEGKI